VHDSPLGMQTIQDERKAIALVRADGDKTYSLCDAQSFVICERLGITEAIAFDEDFSSYVLTDAWRFCFDTPVSRTKSFRL
jgi:predicted nucleic acid-binding protein